MRRQSIPQSAAALVRTELLKLTTTTAPWLVWLAMPALAASAALRRGRGGTAGAPSVGTSGAVEAALGGFGRGAVLALVLGAMLAVTEHRYGTLVGSLLRTPRRSGLAAADGVLTWRGRQAPLEPSDLDGGPPRQVGPLGVIDQSRDAAVLICARHA